MTIHVDLAPRPPTRIVMDAPVFPAVQLACPACGTLTGGDGDERVCAPCGWLARREGQLWVLPGAAAQPPDCTPAVDPTEENGRHLRDLRASESARLIAQASPLPSGGWVPFLPLPERAHLLLLEGGLGGATLALAPYVAGLWVLIPWLDRARLVARRVERACLGHVTICGGTPSGSRLPFATGTFDGAAVHDLHRVRGPLFPGPEAALTAFVLELKRLLRPAGFLVLDGRLRGALAPRRVESVRRGTVRQALDVADLATRRELAYRFDQDDQPYLIQNTRGALPIGTRLRNWAIAALRTQETGFVASSASATTAPTLLEGLLRQLPLGEPEIRRARETVHLGSWEVLRAETAGLIVRIPTSPVGVDRCRANARALRELEDTPMAFATPRLAREGAWRGMSYAAETRLPGRPVSYLSDSPRERERIARSAQEMLADMYDRTQRTVRLDPGALRDLFLNSLERMEPYLEPAAADAIREARDWIRGRFTGAEWTLARTHGDYKTTNFLADRRGRLTGVVDWDLSRPAGLPLADSILLEAFDRSIRDGVPFSRAVYDAGFAALRWRERLPAALQRYITSERQWRATALATLVNYFFDHLPLHLRWTSELRAEFSETVGDASRQLVA